MTLKAHPLLVRFLVLAGMKSTKVRIKENSPLARIAAFRLGYTQIAMVFGRTIHLHNTTAKRFIRQRSWLLHELKHVEQYERLGTVLFLWKYLVENLRNGYYNNAFEVEARAAEQDHSLYLKYDLSDYAGLMVD